MDNEAVNDFRAQFHLFDGSGRATGVFDYRILEYIKSHEFLFFMGGVPYLYNNGVYSADQTGSKLKTIIRELIYPRFVKANTLSRIFQLFVSDFDLQRTQEQVNLYPAHWIPFRNCMLDGKTGEKHSHHPKYYALNQIPWEFTDEITCGSDVESFLASSMNQDDRRTILQYLGMCMCRVNFQKMIILKGGRGTGKSVLLRLFEDVIGAENCSNIPLQRLEENFHGIQVMGKLLNLCADLNATPMRTVNAIKMITGGDTLSDSYKGKDIVTFRPYARLLFSCNDVPTSLDEKSSALFERIIIIAMDKRPENPDRQLPEKLRADIPYLIHLAVNELRELLKDNTLFVSTRSQELIDQLYADSDTVQAFVLEKLERDSSSSVKTTELLAAYRAYCGDAEREPLSRNNFYRNFRNKGYGIKTVHGETYFSGIKFKDEFMSVDADDESPFD